MQSWCGNLTLILLLGGMTGCGIVGPNSISSGRQQYAEAINATNDQQTLNMILAIRYDETFSLMTVASVTANFRISGSLNAEFPIGSEDNYRENLVPLSAGFAYEENPTISYLPMQGEQFIKQLLSPLPIDLVALLQMGTSDPELITLSLINDINGIRNPAFLYPGVERDPRFERLVELITLLSRAGELGWVTDEGPQGGLSLVIFNYATDYLDEVTELAELLGLSADPSTGLDIVLPARLQVGRGQGDSLRVQTRSAVECLRIAAAAVDVPAKHLEDGIVGEPVPLGSVGRFLRIRSSAKPPKNALVAVQRHGFWFYIDRTDLRSKSYFRWLQVLITLRLSNPPTGAQLAPVLTVPVSR
jgi:hypothetical protein